MERYCTYIIKFDEGCCLPLNIVVRHNLAAREE